MGKRNWSQDTALDFVFRNADVKKQISSLDTISLIFDKDTYFVKRGSAGNGTLGAIDYLRKYRRFF